MYEYSEIEKKRAEIAHRCDGPITPFVLIARAIGAAGTCKTNDSADVTANALYEELVERGWLKDGDDCIEITGS